MVRSTYFLQECPTCGRNQEIRVEYLGRTMVCQQCGGSFVAASELSEPAPSHIAPVLAPPRSHSQARAG